MLLLLEQCLNGLQFGLLLFLLAAGLTLVFGIMTSSTSHTARSTWWFISPRRSRPGPSSSGAAGARGDACGRHGGRGRRCGGSTGATIRPRARHVRADPVLQRACPHRLGPGCGCCSRIGSTPGAALPACTSDLPYRHHRHGAFGRARTYVRSCARGSACSSAPAPPTAKWSARSASTSIYSIRSCSASARWRRSPADAGADSDRADRHRREYSDPRIRGDHRRHRPIRGAFIAAIRRARRYGRARLSDRPVATSSPRVLPRRRARASSMLIYLVMAVVLVLRPAGLFPVAGK